MMLAVSCGGAVAADGDPHAPVTAPVLTPSVSLSGARLSTAIDPSGTPSPHALPAGFQQFIQPAAVAGRGQDTYIADIGSGAVYRFDSRFDLMAALPGIRAQPGVQLYVGRDYSLYLLDQPGRRVQHYSRDGQLLATFRDELNLGRPVDMAFDEARGRVLVADGMHGQLVAFHPLGGASYVIPLRSGAGERVFGITAMAIGARDIFLSDPVCACIAQLSLDGAVLATFGHHELNQPGPVAVDREDRVFVVDAFDGSLKVYAQGELIQDWPAADLGLRHINDVWIDDGWVILSDAIGAGVKIMRLAPAR